MQLPGVGHGFSVAANWLPQFRAAFERIATAPGLDRPASAAGVRDLPLVELPSRGPRRGVLALVLSGDGGWASLDRQIGEVLADSGISVVGLDSKQYFWTQRTPDSTAADMVRAIRHYLTAWHLDTVVLVGYSRGADAAPFVASRLPADLRARTPVVALIGAERWANFHFHTLDLLFDRRRPDDIAVAPEVEKLRGIRVLCIYGTEESDTVCPSLPPGTALVRPMAGGHHMGGSYREMALMILEQLR